MADSTHNKWFNRFLITLVVIGTAMLLFGTNHYNRFQRSATKLTQNSEFTEFLANPGVPVAPDDARIFVTTAFEKANVFTRELMLDEQQMVSVDPEGIEQFEELVQRNQQLFDLIDSFVETEKISYVYSEEKGLSPDPLKVLKMASVLQVKARVADAKEDWQEAVSIAKKMFEIARKIECAPSLMNSLAACSIRSYAIQILYKLVEIDQLSEEDSHLFAAILESVDPMDACTRSFKFERFMVMQNARFTSSINSALFHWFSGNHYLNKMSRVIEISSGKMTDPLPPKPYSLIDNTLQALGQHDIESTFMALRMNFADELVGVRSAKILLALHASGLPKENWSISQAMNTELNASDLEDPFTGKNMMLDRSEGMTKIYSVGPNGIDEQGQPGTDDSGLIPDEIFK